MAGGSLIEMLLGTELAYSAAISGTRSRPDIPVPETLKFSTGWLLAIILFPHLEASFRVHSMR
jgi:hypothetical protein